MKHVKINEAIVQAIKNLDIPVDKVDTEKLFSVFMDLMSLIDEEIISSSEVISNKESDIKSTDNEYVVEQDKYILEKETKLRTRFDKVNTICKGLEGDYRPYMDRFLFDLHSLLIESIHTFGPIYVANENHNDEHRYCRHYDIYQGEKGFIDAEFTEDGKIIFMVICYQNYRVKVNLVTGISSFQIKYKSSEKPRGMFEDIDEKDTIEKIEEFNISDLRFAHELVDMVKLVL